MGRASADGGDDRTAIPFRAGARAVPSPGRLRDRAQRGGCHAARAHDRRRRPATRHDPARHPAVLPGRGDRARRAGAAAGLDRALLRRPHVDGRRSVVLRPDLAGRDGRADFARLRRLQRLLAPAGRARRAADHSRARAAAGGCGAARRHRTADGLAQGPLLRAGARPRHVAGRRPRAADDRALRDGADPRRRCRLLRARRPDVAVPAGHRRRRRPGRARGGAVRRARTSSRSRWPRSSRSRCTSRGAVAGISPSGSRLPWRSAAASLPPARARGCSPR